MFMSNLKPHQFGDTARKYGASTVTSLQNNSIEVELYKVMQTPKRRHNFWFGWHHNQCRCCASIRRGISHKPGLHTDRVLFIGSHTNQCSLGELSTITLTFTGGVLTKAVA
jgi:hypothetical protein